MTCLLVGDSARTMVTLCGRPVRDLCWTTNPSIVTCVRCCALLRTGAR